MSEADWDIRRPSFSRYFAAAAVTVPIAVLGMTLTPLIINPSGTRLAEGVEFVPTMFGLIFAYGSPFWAPVFLLSLFPGYFAYCKLVDVVFSRTLSGCIAVGVATIAVSLGSAIGMYASLYYNGVMGDIADIANSLHWGATLPLWFGVPSALIAAYFIPYKKEET